eukprot:scpid94969/ scgid11085/ 
MVEQSVQNMISSCPGATVGCYLHSKGMNFFCNCAGDKAYTGSLCVDKGICDPLDRYQNCSKYPTCSGSTSVGYQCSCSSEFVLNGSTCSLRPACNKCGPSETCTKVGKEYECICSKNISDAVNCSGASTRCFSQYNSSFCQCPTGQVYTGNMCTNDTLCDPENRYQPCSRYPRCNVTAAGHHCQCGQEFTLNGSVCNIIPECAVCAQRANCVQFTGKHKCICRKGYTGKLWSESTNGQAIIVASSKFALKRVC